MLTYLVYGSAFGARQSLAKNAELGGRASLSVRVCAGAPCWPDREAISAFGEHSQAGMQ